MKQQRRMMYKTPFGEELPVQVVATRYESTGNLCLRLVSLSSDVSEPVATITVNVDEMPPYMAYIKDDAENEGMLEFITGNELGYMVLKKSAKIPYTVVQFDEEKLREVKCEGLENYHQTYSSQNRKKRGRTRDEER